MFWIGWVACGGGDIDIDVNQGGDFEVVIDSACVQDADFSVECIGLAMDFQEIESGTFVMGAANTEVGQDGNEQPHTVELTHRFYMMHTEVSQRQYQSLMGDNPSYFNGCKNCPVDQVTWHDAARFANRLSEIEERTPCYSCTEDACEFSGDPYLCEGFRLPTEAEWEYAARSGSDKAFWTPNGGANIPIESSWACGGLYLEDGTLFDDLSWYCGNSNDKTQPVGTLLPNGFGLHDMHGNVWEWCHDWFEEYTEASQTDPYGPEMGSTRVGRGGFWFGIAPYLRAADRDFDAPNSSGNYMGFRVAITAP